MKQENVFNCVCFFFFLFYLIWSIINSQTQKISSAVQTSAFNFSLSQDLLSETFEISASESTLKSEELLNLSSLYIWLRTDFFQGTVSSLSYIYSFGGEGGFSLSLCYFRGFRLQADVTWAESEVAVSTEVSVSKSFRYLKINFKWMYHVIPEHNCTVCILNLRIGGRQCLEGWREAIKCLLCYCRITVAKPWQNGLSCHLRMIYANSIYFRQKETLLHN